MNKNGSLLSRVCFDMAVIIIQLLLIVGFVCVANVRAKPQWRWEETHTSLPPQQAPLRIYSFIPDRNILTRLTELTPFVENYRINDAYIQQYLSEVSINFIKRYNTDDKLEYEILEDSHNAFSYRLFHNNVATEWVIYVKEPNQSQTPQITVTEQAVVS